MDIFNIHTPEDFAQLAWATFQRQAREVRIYAEFIRHLGIRVDQVQNLEQIPFLPIQFFKSKPIVSDETALPSLYFQSSGTGSVIRSRHYIKDPSIYQTSLRLAFEKFLGKPQDYIILGLLPNYQENPHSSLIYMTDLLMKISAHPKNAYFGNDFQSVLEVLSTPQERKILLFGVSFSLLDFADYLRSLSTRIHPSNNLTIIETGGMKGRKKELTKIELLNELQTAFPKAAIYSEYSMTELLSQAYTVGKMQYATPAWMRIAIRQQDDPLSPAAEGQSGGVNIIDLANQHSCSFIATDDLGRLTIVDTSYSIHPLFEILGRMDHSEIRGCSQLMS